MTKPELVYLTEPDAIDSFAPEKGVEPARAVVEPARAVNERADQSLDVFRSEVFAAPTRSSVSLHTRSRVPAALFAVAGIAAVFAVVVALRSNAGMATPLAPVAAIFGTGEPAPALPPQT